MSRSRIGIVVGSDRGRRIRPFHAVLLGALIAGALISVVAGAASATPGSATQPAPSPPPMTTGGTTTIPRSGATPPATVTGIRITHRPGTLRRGSRVPRADVISHRVFLDARHGYALATVGDADYPVRTANGGRTWRTDGPAVHLHAAQAPLAVTDAGAANRRTLFACCGAQVVDATGDAGGHWWQAFLGDVVIAVETRPGGKLIAVAQTAANPSGSQAATWIYVSTDGGHHWHLDMREGAD